MSTNETEQQQNMANKSQSSNISAKDANPSGGAHQHVATIDGTAIVGGAIAGDVTGIPVIGGNDRVDIKFPRRKSVYYSVTESEIESYAQFGLLSNICLTLFGLLAGFGLGCVAALAQGNIPDAGKTTLSWLIGISMVIALIFLALSLFLAYAQNTSKKTWRTDNEE